MSFKIVGISFRDSGHGVGVGGGVLQVVVGAISVEEAAQSVDVGSFAGRLFACAIGLGELGGSCLDVVCGRRCEKLMEVRHRFSPVGDGAIGIGRGNALKSREGAAVPERVQ